MAQALNHFTTLATVDSPRPPLKLFSGHECANRVVLQLSTEKVHGESGTKSTHIILPVVPDSPCICFGCPVQHFNSQNLVLPPRAPFRSEACHKTSLPPDFGIPRRMTGDYKRCYVFNAAEFLKVCHLVEKLLPKLNGCL